MIRIIDRQLRGLSDDQFFAFLLAVCFGPIMTTAAWWAIWQLSGIAG